MMYEDNAHQQPSAPYDPTRRASIVAQIPGWYNPIVHLAIPSILGLLLMLGALLRIEHVRLLDLAALPITIFASFGFEWRAHKFILHKRRPLLGLLYERHEKMHHVIYTYDHMTMESSKELWLVLMPAYAIGLVFVMVLPLAYLVGLVFGQNPALLMIIASMAFFLSYEWLHMAYHLPENSFLGRRPLIRRLRELHRRHHEPRLMKQWNFNVTLPVFDWILGTLWSPEKEAAKQKARALRKNLS